MHQGIAVCPDCDYACAQVMAANGIQLLRTWAFCNGVAFPCDNGNSLQPTVMGASP